MLSWWLGQSNLCILLRCVTGEALPVPVTPCACHPLLGALPVPVTLCSSARLLQGQGRCWPLLGGSAKCCCASGLVRSQARCEPHLTGLNHIIGVYKVTHFVKWLPNLWCKFGNADGVQGPLSYSALSVGRDAVVWDRLIVDLSDHYWL